MANGLSTQRSRVSPVDQILRVDDLSAGLELRLSPSLLKPAQARRLRNWSLQEPGALVTYPGWSTFTGSSLGARRIQGGSRIYISGIDPFTLAGDNGNVYKPTDAGVWGSAVLASLSTSNELYFPHDRTLVAAFDGMHIPKKSVNGTTWTQFGIDAPATNPTATAVSGGSLVTSDTYEFSYTYMDSTLGAESNESNTVQVTVSGSNLTARVGVTASTDPQVDTIVLYARDTTEAVRRKVAEYSNSTTTHDVASVTWTTNTEAPTDHNVPIATLGWAVVWKNRWWAVDTDVKNRIYFTQVFQNQSWPTLFFIDIPFERGDQISALVPQGDTLIVFGKASKPYIIIGQTSLDFEVRPALGAQAGAFGPRACEAIENGVVHVSAEGAYIFDGASDRLLSYNIDPGWRDMVQNSAATDLDRIPVVYHALRKELRVGVPRLYPWGVAGEWVLDLNRTRTQDNPAWTSTDRPSGGYIHWNGPEPTEGDRGRLFSWTSATTAKLYEEATGTSADGSDMTCDWEGATHAVGGYMASFSDSYVEVQPAVGTFAITPVIDAAALTSQTIDVNTGLLPYGSSEATYGTATRLYGSKGRAYCPFMLPLEAEGRTISFRTRYQGHALFKMFSYGTTLQPEPALSGI